jgi:cysteine-rich repeat protein
MPWGRVRTLAACVAATVVMASVARPAGAGCNVIPPAVESFRGTLGSTDRPFARPGDWLRVALDPACHGGSAGFAAAAGDQVVTIVFTPPVGPRNVAMLAESCAAVDTASCAARADVDTATCLEVNGGGAPALEVIDSRTLRFRFPDTDGLFRDGGDDLTFSGPATVAVSAAGAPLPCGLASLPCTRVAGLLACVDQLRAENGTCNAQPHATFNHFTALPPPNDYQRLCSAPTPPCTGTVDELRFTVDAAGNLLVPMDWRGVRVDRDAVPVARLLRASIGVEAFEGRGVPIRVLDLDSLGSYSPGGIKLPPLFDPQQDPTAAGSATFFGSTDAEETVLRLARHRLAVDQCVAGANAGLPCAAASDCPGGACGAPTCVGGTDAGAACSTDFDCSGGECGPGLFDFSTRLYDGAGPVLVRLGACLGGANASASCTDDGDCPGGQCGAFTLSALDPVPLDGLNQSAALNAFVVEEAIADPPADLNGDGDAIDPVVTLADRVSGLGESIGSGGSRGRAVVRVQQPPFSFPALAVADDLIAFLEPEPSQGAVDTTGNSRVFETVLRVFRLGDGDVTVPLAPLSADAAPLLDGRSLAIADGRVFFRSGEAAGAAQETTRASVDGSGAQGLGGLFGAQVPSLSHDGRYVAFISHATNLVPDDTDNVFDVFVRDRVADTTVRVNLTPSGGNPNGPSIFSPFVSASGRWVAFSSFAGNLVPGDTNNVGGGIPGSCQDVFVHDRDADADGIFDETGPGERHTVRVSVASDGAQADLPSRNDIGSISPDGRFVTFSSQATDLVQDDTNGMEDVFLHDRDADADGILDETGPGERATVRISVDADGLDANAGSFSATASGDGRFVVFQSDACDLVPGDCAGNGDNNGVSDVFLRDRDTDADGIFDEPGAANTVRITASGGIQPNAETFEPRISTDGSSVLFVSLASNLVAGDTNGFRDVFAFDRATGRVTAITVSPAGRIGNGNSGSPSVSVDGRYVTFSTHARNLVAQDNTAGVGAYLHDRATRLTARLHATPSGGPADGFVVPAVALSGDGSTAAYQSNATDLVAGDTNMQPDIFVRGAAAGDGDLTGDGRATATVLRVLDAGTGPPSTLIDLCPADAVSIAAGRAAFLRPEAAGDTPALAACPSAPLIGGAPDLNFDGDAADAVVHLWDGATTLNLGRAARAVALSPTWVAALVGEADEGDSDLNADGDRDDAVVHLHPAGAGAWTNLGRAADTLALAGTRVAYLTPERAQGSDDLNGDGDADDRVVHAYDAASATAHDVGEAAEELVLGATGLLAFRTAEAAQGGLDLNDDGDADDGVLQVFDAASGTLLNSRQAVTPCRLEACDPRLPYRVRNDTVTFLTLEADQDQDLNGDGDLGDLVVQVLNVRQACSSSGPAGNCHTLAATSAGICTDSGDACAGDEACPAGDCFVPPGGCVRDLGTPCNPLSGSGCTPPAQFCQPLLGTPGQGTCFALGDACQSDAECTAPATCSNSGQAFQRLMDPLTDQGDGAAVFTGAGRCTENLATMCAGATDCEPGEFCVGGLCHRQHGTCAGDADCPPSAWCEAELVRATADDGDHDELPDVLDNCPQVANVTQADGDEDGVGDACDAETCGNGVAEGDEECDDGDTIGGDGCEADCGLAATPIGGTKLLVKDSASQDERSLIFISTDRAALAAPVGAAQDPTVGGARLELFNDTTGERVPIALPAARWRGLGNPAGSTGYKYADPSHVAGPCSVVLLKPGRTLKAKCRGPIAFTLNEPAQTSLRVALRLGPGNGALKLCAQFGGTVHTDRPTANGQSGLFKASGAPAPTSCPR